VTLVEETEADQDGKFNSSQSTYQPIKDLSEALNGKWYVVEYDQDVYTGIVQAPSSDQKVHGAGCLGLGGT
jgi:hypothetical protein